MPDLSRFNKVLTPDELARFTRPNIQTVELVLANGAQNQIMPDQFRHRGRRWVKRVILSSTDMDDIVNPPPVADTSFLQQITGRWWRRMRDEASGVLAPLTNFDNQEWTQNVPRALGAGPQQYKFAWNFDHTFVVPDNDVMFADICNRAVIAGNLGLGAGSLMLSLHGHGASTGMPRILQNPVAWVSTLGAPATRLMNTAPTTQNAINQYGEDIIAEKLLIWSNSALTPVADVRIWNHITMRVYFESKAHLSLTGPDVDNFVPVIAYGSHRNTNGYVAIWEPYGNPLITEDMEALGWEFANAAGQAERISVSIVSLLEE